MLGQAFHGLKQPEPAVKALEHAAALDPRDALTNKAIVISDPQSTAGQ